MLALALLSGAGHGCYRPGTGPGSGPGGPPHEECLGRLVDVDEVAVSLIRADIFEHAPAQQHLWMGTYRAFCSGTFRVRRWERSPDGVKHF